ncbi:MAG: glycoside hydrolase family 32 protein [Planctomycetota bacterium]
MTSVCKKLVSVFLLTLVPFAGIARAGQPPIPPERKLQLTGDLLILPSDDRSKLKKGEETADLAMIEVFVDGMLIHRAHGVFPRNLADARYWAFLDMKEFKGKEAVIKTSLRGATPERAKEILGWIESSDTMRHIQPIYKEGGRPQFHFSQIQGWNNDPNGMVYSDGMYHLSWQCNPLENGFGGWYWGHAVSEDLVHWRECPRTLRSNGFKDVNRYPGMANNLCFSGGAAIDVNNTLGKQVGGQKTIIAAFTDSPNGDSIAYSTDGGFRYTVMRDINPVIVHPIPEGSKWSGSFGRDPKPIWHEPTKSWVIVTYRMGKLPDACSGHMAFYTSKDLKKWEFQSMTEKLFPEEKQKADDADFHECPEFLELPVDGDKNNKKWVLMDATPKYQIGSFDGKKFTPDLKEYRRSIFGGMKAGQCFSNAPDGRAIMMIWVRQGYGQNVPFASGFTLPLELTLRTADDGVRLYANPVKELETLREKEIFSAKDKKIGGTETVSFDAQEQLIEVLFTVKKASKSGAIEIKFGNQSQYYLLDQKQFGDNPIAKNLHDKCIVHDKDDGKIDFRFYFDRATWEAFVENGAVYKIGQRGNIAAPVGKISVGTFGGAEGVLESMTVYKLKSIWPENVNTLTYSGKK